MRGQWGLIIGLIAVFLIAIFAVLNVEPVPVNYLFGQNDWPLVLVIIFSVLLGGLMIGSVGMVKIYQLQQKLKAAEKGNSEQIPEENLYSEEKVNEEPGSMKRRSDR